MVTPVVTQLQRRRGTKAEHDLFTGAAGEVTLETTNNRLHVHDASKLGGFPVPNYEDIQNNAFNAGTVTGTDTLVLTLDDAPSAYAQYQSFWITPAANNTGAVTININTLGVKAIEKDDGAGALTALEADDLKAGIPVEIIYNGTKFIAQLSGGSAGGWQFVSEITISSPTATVDFDNVFEDGYDYEIILENIQPTNDNVSLLIRTSTDGGSTWLAAAAYGYSMVTIESTGGVYDSVFDYNATAVFLNLSFPAGVAAGNAGNEQIQCQLRINNPANSGTSFFGSSSLQMASANASRFANSDGGFAYSPTTYNAYDSIQFFFSVGSVESGKFRVYRKAIA